MKKDGGDETVCEGIVRNDLESAPRWLKTNEKPNPRSSSIFSVLP